MKKAGIALIVAGSCIVLYSQFISPLSWKPEKVWRDEWMKHEDQQNQIFKPSPEVDAIQDFEFEVGFAFSRFNEDFRNLHRQSESTNIGLALLVGGIFLFGCNHISRYL